MAKINVGGEFRSAAEDHIVVDAEGVRVGNKTLSEFLQGAVVGSLAVQNDGHDVISLMHDGSIHTTGGFYKDGSSNEEVLLGGGGTKSLGEIGGGLSENSVNTQHIVSNAVTEEKLSADVQQKLNNYDPQTPSVTGVKGSAETGNPRVGDVVISAANVGALPIEGGQMVNNGFKVNVQIGSDGLYLAVPSSSNETYHTLLVSGNEKVYGNLEIENSNSDATVTVNGNTLGNMAFKGSVNTEDIAGGAVTEQKLSQEVQEKLNTSGSGTDEKVKQTFTDEDKKYRVLLSGHDADNEFTEGTYKNGGLTYNPATHSLINSYRLNDNEYYGTVNNYSLNEACEKGVTDEVSDNNGQDGQSLPTADAVSTYVKGKFSGLGNLAFKSAVGANEISIGQVAYTHLNTDLQNMIRSGGTADDNVARAAVNGLYDGTYVIDGGSADYSKDDFPPIAPIAEG